MSNYPKPLLEHNTAQCNSLIKPDNCLCSFKHVNVYFIVTEYLKTIKCICFSFLSFLNTNIIAVKAIFF